MLTQQYWRANERNKRLVLGGRRLTRKFFWLHFNTLRRIAIFVFVPRGTNAILGMRGSDVTYTGRGSTQYITIKNFYKFSCMFEIFP